MRRNERTVNSRVGFEHELRPEHSYQEYEKRGGYRYVRDDAMHAKCLHWYLDNWFNGRMCNSFLGDGNGNMIGFDWLDGLHLVLR